ncbi:hypothetical protein Bbelb_373560 [Branchiostoma belcheri]|nr:hypothetical protein Bbelb_373560 [Branchiostoma belcheri]
MEFNKAHKAHKADSLFRDVDPDRAFQGKSTKLHRNSTITAAITNIRNMKDTATKTVILHVGLNDLDNNKHKQESVRTTVKNTCELIEVTKQSFLNANVAVSQDNTTAVCSAAQHGESVGWTSLEFSADSAEASQLRSCPRMVPAGPCSPTRSFVPARGGLRGEHARSNENTVPLGPRIPSRQTSTANPTAENQVSSSLHVVKPAVLTTLQQGTLKHLKLPWKQVGKNIRKAWNTLMS